MRNWKIISWANKPAATKIIEFHCENCNGISNLEVGLRNPILAQLGMAVVYDKTPTGDEMPEIMRCPHCRHTFERCERRTPDVR